MINDYVSFNAARFVKDYYKYIGIVDGLKEQLHELDYIRSVPTDSDKVLSTPKADQVEKLVLRRIAIEEKIEQYQWHIETFEKAYNDLLTDEKKVIEVFFTSDSKASAIATLAKKGIPQSTAYIIRKQALEKISYLISGLQNQQ